MDSRKIVLSALLLAMSLVISLLESFAIPYALIPIPGFKLGIANVFLILSIYVLGAFPAFAIMLSRSVIIFLFTGNVTALAFSLAGGFLGLTIMLLLRNTKRFSIYGVSAGGAFGHAVGQIICAVIISGAIEIVYYLPILTIASVAAGCITAFLNVPIFKTVELMDKTYVSSLD